MNRRFGFAAALLVVSAASAAPTPTAPYAGQEQREIKALSAEEIQSYLAGSGHGFAKAAELNHFPGPSHVLAHASALELSEAQMERTNEIFAAMQTEAKRLGVAVVEKERELDRLFSSGEINSESLKSLLEQLSQLQSSLRRVHLQAHLEQKALMTPGQVATYDRLRGYAAAQPPGQSGSHQH